MNDVDLLLAEADRIKDEDGRIDAGALSFNFRAARLRREPKDRDTYRHYQNAVRRAMSARLIHELPQGGYQFSNPMLDDD